MKANRVGIMVCAAVITAGCAGGGSRVKVSSSTANVTVSLSLPKGWAVEGRAQGDMALFSETANPQNRGGITIWPDEGKALAAWVDANYVAQSQRITQGAQMLGEATERLAGRRAGQLSEQALSSTMSSRTPRKVGELEAIEVTEQAHGLRAIRVFTHKDGAVCEVFFASLPGQWQANEPLFRAALDTLRAH